MSLFHLWLACLSASIDIWLVPWLSLARASDHKTASLGHDIGKRRLRLVHSR